MICQPCSRQCPKCGETMNFIGHDDDGDFDDGDAYWICDNCGLKVYEGEVYKYCRD